MKNCVKLLLLMLGLASTASADTPEQILTGIRENLQDNMAACTEENLPRLLACMSVEMPNRALFVHTVRQTWAEEDAYHRVDDVQLLASSNAPYARTNFPYATALVTQTVIKVNDRKDLQNCPRGQCKSAEDTAHLMSISPHHETTRLQMLFKKEQGRWKLIAGLTAPEPVTPPAEQPAQRSVFH